MVKGTSAGSSVQGYVGWIIKESWLTLSPNQKKKKKKGKLIGCSYSNVKGPGSFSKFTIGLCMLYLL